jgi:DUF1680 family protein
LSTITNPSRRDTADGAARRQLWPIPFTQVTIEDSFWAPRQKVNRERTIPHIYRQLVETRRIDAFRPGWSPDDSIRRRDSWGGTVVMFWDSDVAKWIEAASLSLATNPDPELDALLDEVIAIIAQAQHENGYLNTWFTSVDPQNRWKNLRDWHELYCAGHMIEAGVAHFQATGKRSLLQVVCRLSDHIEALFGTAPEQQRGYCGHPEIELALVKLARATGELRYMELSRYFVDERGRQPHYFDQEAIARGDDPTRFWAKSHEYNQSHLPVREQTEVVGHAVRAVYLYCAMADLAGEYGDAGLLEACRRLWTHLTTRRMYVMGGIGTSMRNEGFTRDYDLPNESAYAETCAAIGLIFWAHRMLTLDLNRRYADILELALFNAVISGVSLDGERFYYDNPLASDGSHHRRPWFACPCCPPNLARILASLEQYLYAQSDDEIVVHLYAQSEAQFEIGGQTVTLRQETSYPWDGQVAIKVAPQAEAEFTLCLRLPGWCQSPHISVNGETVEPAGSTESGYLRLRRTWRPDDTIALALPMPVERIYAHPAVRADVGQVALRRGPIVYCFEQTDSAAPLDRVVLAFDAPLIARSEPELLDGVVVVEAEAEALDEAGWDGALYLSSRPQTQPVKLRGIPYFAWDNREPGAMTVWVRER